MYVFSNANAADYTIKLAHNGPEQHPFQDGALAFKSELEKSSNGAIEVQIFPGEQLGDEESTSQMIKLGTLQCAIESAGGGLAPFVPEADLLNLPFVFCSIQIRILATDSWYCNHKTGIPNHKIKWIFAWEKDCCFAPLIELLPSSDASTLSFF